VQDKILVVCGPTATGKTSLGIELAKKFNGEIISADSRQVYKEMDIGTGKEWGEGVDIWGYDLVAPKEDFNVSQFLKFAEEKILDIKSRKKIPIIVGGTGFYIKGIVDGIETVEIPQNKSLRKILEEKTVDELFEMLSGIDPFQYHPLYLLYKNLFPQQLLGFFYDFLYLVFFPLQILEIERH
jgi:tRNA dimethylallyltransferase